MNKKDLQKEFIYKKRGEILTELAEYLAEVGHDMTVDEALLRVQEDDGEDVFQDFVIMLADNGDVPDPESAQ